MSEGTPGDLIAGGSAFRGGKFGSCPMPKKSKQATLSIEAAKFAAQVRGARAILNWSQTELGERTGFTQRSIHKLEQGSDIRRSTALAIVKAFRDAGIDFEELPSGPFKIVVSLQALEAGTATGK
jgi:DNA-binding XRE family transcriptional regulator